MVCLTIWGLLPGSQASVCDVAESHHTVPITPAQWPGLIIKLQDTDSYAVNTCCPFGLCSSSGCYGHIRDAGMDLMQAPGIGPLSTWANDHIFFHIPCQYLTEYNQQCKVHHGRILCNGIRIQTGSCYWYKGDTMQYDHVKEFNDDNSFPILDFSSSSLRSPTNADHSYALTDIDTFLLPFSIPWELMKDIPCSSAALFIGFQWDLTSHTVLLLLEKCKKYLAVITSWEETPHHTLWEVEAFMVNFSMPPQLSLPVEPTLQSWKRCWASTVIIHSYHVPYPNTSDDLIWWMNILASPPSPRPIPRPHEVLDLGVFSNASSSTGISIILRGCW